MPILPVGWHPDGRHRHEVGVFPVVVDPLLDLFLVRGDRRPAVDIPMPAVAVPVEALVEAPVFCVGLPKHNQRICVSLFV